VSDEAKKIMEEWLKDKPESVKELARRHPLGTVFVIRNVRHYLMGYLDGGEGLILSTVNPGEDYDKAIEQRRVVSYRNLQIIENN